MTGNRLVNIPNIDLTDDINSLSNLILDCDLIVTIDNSTAHLSSSLGKQTWVLLPYSGDCRWFENIDQSLWYKNTTIFRQGSNRMWSDVIKTISKKLVNYNCNKENV